MEKIARKPSTDPVQERLRQNKANWNKEVSSFVNDLIHFKKMMNGWPSKFHKERSRIADPVPADPATIVGSLAGDFQEIVNKGNAIIQEQLNYSKNRRKRQPKQLNLPFQQPTTPTTPSQTAPPKPQQDISKQLELGLGADDSYQLISLASNPLTRFFSRLLNPGVGLDGARIRKYRMSLLNSALQMSKDLKRMQSSVVGSGPQSIFLASKLLDRAEDNWVFLHSGFNTYIENLPGGAKDVGGTISTPKEDVKPSSTGAVDPQVAKALIAVKDIQAHANNFTNVGMPTLLELAKQFSIAPHTHKERYAGPFLDRYQKTVSQLSIDKGLPPQSSLADIEAMQSKSANRSQNQIQVIAQAFLKKLRHQISPFDKTSSFRLDIYKIASENRKLLDKVMNDLEKGLDQQLLSGLFNEIGANMKKIRTLMYALSSTIRGQGYQPQFMNLLEQGRMGEHGVDLDPKQQEQLGKLLRQKQLRDLVKMYGR